MTGLEEIVRTFPSFIGDMSKSYAQRPYSAVETLDDPLHLSLLVLRKFTVV